MKERFNFNTFISLFIAGLVAVVGYFCKHELESIEQNQRDLRSIIVPKAEVEAQIELLKQGNAQGNRELLDIRREILDLRTRVIALEARRP